MSDRNAAEVDDIRVLNAQMHAEEKRGAGGLGFYRELLDQTLRFRRASGGDATVTNHVYHVLEKLHVSTRGQAIASGSVPVKSYSGLAGHASSRELIASRTQQ